MILSVVYIIIGLILLVFGGNWLEKGSVNLARHFGVSNLVVGLVITSLATSSPELFVNITSAINGHTDLALANVIGSNNVNILIVLGISGLIFPITIDKTARRRDLPLSLIFTLLLLLLANDFFVAQQQPTLLSRFDGIIFLIIIVAYIIFTIKTTRDDNIGGGGAEINIGRAIILVVMGVAALVGGSNLMLDGSIEVASHLGVSEKIIGLTIVAVGTSLPELVTSIVAAKKNEVDMAIGNVLGSNIFNILLILGATAVISPVSFVAENLTDVCFMIFSSVLVWIFTWTGERLVRWEGAVMVICYAAFLVYAVARVYIA